MHRRGDLATLQIGNEQIQCAVQDSCEIARGQRMAYQVLGAAHLVASHKCWLGKAGRVSEEATQGGDRRATRSRGVRSGPSPPQPTGARSPTGRCGLSPRVLACNLPLTSIELELKESGRCSAAAAALRQCVRNGAPSRDRAIPLTTT